MIGAVVLSTTCGTILELVELLLTSLEHQSCTDFHVIIADDDSAEAPVTAEITRQPLHNF